MINDAAKVAADSATIVAIDGQAESVADAGGGAMLMLTHLPGKSPHAALVPIVGFSWLVGMLLAWLIYRNGLEIAARIKRTYPLNLVHTALENKLYFDHVYDAVLGWRHGCARPGGLHLRPSTSLMAWSI